MKCKFLFALLLVMLLTILVVSCSGETINSTSVETTSVPIDSIAPSTIESTVLSPEVTPISTLPTTTTTPITSTAPVVYTISPDEAKEMMDQGGVIVIDVRRADEYETGHIPGAILVPNETIESEASSQLPNKKAVLLIYCRSGRRSAEAAQKLLSIGYLHVYDFGGIIDWPYEITQ